MPNKTRSFDMSDEDYSLLSDYAYANRISAARAMRYLIRTHCGTDTGPPHEGLILDADVRRIVAQLVSKLQGRGKPDGELFNSVVNQLIRRGAKR